MTQPLLQAADLRGAARLTPDVAAGLAGLIEAMHAVGTGHSPSRGTGSASKREPDLAGLACETVSGITRVVGNSAEALLGWLGTELMSPTALRIPLAQREAVAAALNGVLGDYLAATDNPLAIRMAIRSAGNELVLERFSMRSALPDATPKLLVLLHGSCMNDLQWHHDDHDHGETLARESGYTPVYLHYNSGLSISTNGRVLAPLLERLFDAWPVAVERLVLLGHGMGGLVARSALHHGALIQRGGLRWPSRMTDLVCIGTPHLGLARENAGKDVGLLLSATPFATSLAHLGQTHSAGLVDWQSGNVLGGSFGDPGECRGPQVPLPEAVHCCAIAASLSVLADTPADRTLGDGLVPVHSALGWHRDPSRRLRFAESDQAVVHGTGHLDLLSSPAVSGLLQKWL